MHYLSRSPVSPAAGYDLVNFDAVPQGVLFYRSLTQWLGGMGPVFLAAVLPALGIGGLDLIASEAPGPTADRLTLRVRDTARQLWLLYGAMTGASHWFC